MKRTFASEWLQSTTHACPLRPRGSNAYHDMACACHLSPAAQTAPFPYRSHDATISKFRRCLWTDDETPLGLYAAATLAYHDDQYVPLLFELLSTADLDHCGWINEQLGTILGRREWSDNALRVVSLYLSRSQHGKEAIERWLEEGLAQALAERGQTRHLLQLITDDYANHHDDSFAQDMINAYRDVVNLAVADLDSGRS